MDLLKLIAEEKQNSVEFKHLKDKTYLAARGFQSPMQYLMVNMLVAAQGIQIKPGYKVNKERVMGDLVFIAAACDELLKELGEL